MKLRKTKNKAHHRKNNSLNRLVNENLFHQMIVVGSKVTKKKRQRAHQSSRTRGQELKAFLLRRPGLAFLGSMETKKKESGSLWAAYLNKTHKSLKMIFQAFQIMNQEVLFTQIHSEESQLSNNSTKNFRVYLRLIEAQKN